MFIFYLPDNKNLSDLRKLTKADMAKFELKNENLFICSSCRKMPKINLFDDHPLENLSQTTVSSGEVFSLTNNENYLTNDLNNDLDEILNKMQLAYDNSATRYIK